MTFDEWFEEAWRTGEVTAEYRHEARICAQDGWNAALRNQPEARTITLKELELAFNRLCWDRQMETPDYEMAKIIFESAEQWRDVPPQPQFYTPSEDK